MAKYKKARIRKICEMIRKDTFTIAEICRAVGISEETYHCWKREKPEFSESIKKAEEDRRERLLVAANRSLFKLIEGFFVEEIKTVYVDSKKKDASGKPISKIRVQTVTTKYIHPDILAVIFALCNLDPENWKRNQRNEVKIKGNLFKDLLVQVSYRDSTTEALNRKSYSELLNKEENDQLDVLHNKLLISNLKSEG